MDMEANSLYIGQLRSHVMCQDAAKTCRESMWDTPTIARKNNEKATSSSRRLRQGTAVMLNHAVAN